MKQSMIIGFGLALLIVSALAAAGGDDDDESDVAEANRFLPRLKGNDMTVDDEAGALRWR
jgi:hypothetical protein